MKQCEVDIVNRLGLHARAAAKVVELATTFSSKITFAKGDQEADAKSIMSVMMLAATRDSKVEICTHGEDEDAALKALSALVRNRFRGGGVSICLHGVGASKGVSIGRLTLVRQSQLRITEHQIDDREIEAEVARFEYALKLARADLQRVCDQLPKEGAADAASLLNVHLLMLNDPSLTEHPIAIVREHRCTAQWALKLQRDTITAVFDAIDEPYLRDRKEDVDHVVDHVQRILASDGMQRPLGAVDHSRVADRIVFADDLSPADAVLMHQQNVAALLTGYGGITSHTAILARGLQIPAVVGLNQARPFLREDDEVIVDGHRGVVIIAPSELERTYYTGRLTDSTDNKVQREKLLVAPVVTRDGQRIVLQANVELSSGSDFGSIGGSGRYRSLSQREPVYEPRRYS